MRLSRLLVPFAAALMMTSLAADALADAENPEITVIFQTEAGFAFFNPIKAGAEDAAEALVLRLISVR